MAVDKETRILKSNTIEQFRQKTNKVSLHVGDTDQLNTLYGDKVFDYSNPGTNSELLQGSDDNSLLLKFNVKPDETLDNTGGYIILKGSFTLHASFTENANLTQSGGFSATIVSASSKKILVKNTSGTFADDENLTVGSDNIAAANVVRLVTESYKVGVIRVFKNGTELPQDMSASGFHVAPLSAVIALTGSPALAGYEEGTTVSQSGGFTGTVLKATSTALFLKTSSGTYNTNQNITGGDAAIANTKHTGITTKDIAFGNAIELNTPIANNTDDIQIKATSLVDALNEIQDDVGNIASLGTIDKTDIVTAINELETAAKGTQANYSLTTSAGDFKSAINELDAEIGTVSALDDAAGYTQTVVVPAITEIQGKIGEVTTSNLGTSASTIVTAIKEHEDQIGDANINSIASGNNTITGALTQLHTEVGSLSLNTAASDLTGAINEIEGVFDASAKKIVSTPDFTLDVEGDIILDANGQEIKFKDGGTQFGTIRKDGNDLQILSNIGDGDMVFRGITSGFSLVEALKFDMSDTGTATFSHDIKLPDSGQAIFGADSDLRIQHNGTNGKIEAFTGDLILITQPDDQDVVIQADDGSGGITTYIRADGSTGEVKLAHYGSTKLKTLPGGVLVTGELESTTLDVNGAGDISGNLTIGGVLDVGQLNAKFTNRNNVKLALNELHDELGNAVMTGTNTAAAGQTNLTNAINAIDAEIGVTNTILNSVGTHGATTVTGVLSNLSTAIVSNDGEIATLNTFKTNIEARNIVAGTGLTGGGNLSASRTLNVIGGDGITANANDIQVDNTVLRTSGNRNIASGTTITFDSGSSLIVNGTLTISGSASGVSTFGVNFVEVDGSGNQQGLQVKNSFSGYSVDPRIQWNHSQVASNPTRAWQLVGLAADGSTADTTDIVTYTNFGDLADGTHLEKSGTSLRIKDSGVTTAKIADDAVTFAKIQNISANRLLGRGSGSGAVSETQVQTAMIASEAVTNAKLAGSITNAKLTNSSISVNGSAVSLGGSLTIQGTANEVEVGTSGSTITVGLPNNVTIGNNLTVTGNLQVDGTTTTINTATLDVEDLNITVGKNASNSAAADTSGLTFGNYTGKATLTYSHSGTKLVSNKDFQATRFLGPVTGDVTGNADTSTKLATARAIALSGDVTGTANFDGSANISITTAIGANKVGLTELGITDGSNGQVLQTDGSGNLSFGTVSTTNNFVDSVAFNTSNGVLTLGRSGLSDLTVDLDGRFSTTDTVTRLKGTGGSFQTGDITIAASGATSVSQSGTTITISSTDTNTQLSQEQVEDFVGGMLDGTESGITVSYDDDNGNIDFVVGGVTNAMLAGSIAASKLAGSIPNNKLSNSSVSLGGVSVALGAADATPAFDLSDATGLPTTALTGTITNDQLAGSIAASKLAGGIGNGKLSNSTISGVSLGSNLNNLTVDNSSLQLNSGTTYNGSAGRTISVKAGGITNAMLAGSIANGKLANSSVSFGGVTLALGASDATPAFDLSDATNVPAGQLTGTVANARLTTNNVTNATENGAGNTLTLTRQGASNTVFGPFDNYSSFSVTDGSESDTVSSGQSITFAAGTGMSVDQTDRTVTYTPTLNAIKGVRLETSGGSLIDNVDETGLEQRITLKEGTNIDLQNSGGEIVINGPAVNNANNLTTGTLNKARLDNDLRGAINRIGSTSGNTFAHFNSSTDIQLFVNNQHNATLEDDGDFLVRGDLVAVSSAIASDEKLKEGIRKVEGALELVSQLDGVTFNWKDSGKQSAGVIAQKVEKVLPSAVSEVDNLDNDRHKVVDYNQLSALFIEAIKELKEQNKELKDEIEALKNINSNS